MEQSNHCKCIDKVSVQSESQYKVNCLNFQRYAHNKTCTFFLNMQYSFGNILLFFIQSFKYISYLGSIPNWGRIDSNHRYYSGKGWM